MSALKANLALAAFVTLSCAATAPAHANGEGRLLFVNSGTGRVVGAGINKNGDFETSFDVTIPSQIGKDTVIPTASGFILYSYANGGAQQYLMDANASIKPGPLSYPFSAKWEYTIGAGNYSLFYDLNGNQAIGAIVESYPDGSLHQTYTNTNFSPWTTIGQTDNYLLFYNSATGAAVTGTIDDNGQLFQNTTASTLRTGYTNFATVGDDVLLWNFHNGLWESGAINFTGTPSGAQYVSAKVAAGDSLGLVGFDLSVQTSGHLLLYNSATGATIVGHFIHPLQSAGPVGKFVEDQSFTLAKFFTNLVRCGDFLVFYQYGIGQLQVGYIDFTGAYQATQSFPMGVGLSLAVSQK